MFLFQTLICNCSQHDPKHTGFARLLGAGEHSTLGLPVYYFSQVKTLTPGFSSLFFPSSQRFQNPCSRWLWQFFAAPGRRPLKPRPAHTQLPSRDLAKTPPTQESKAEATQHSTFSSEVSSQASNREEGERKKC